VAIAALCVVIILHELGHYLAAVWTGMRVDRFSVFGIGPPILKLGTWRGTEIVVSAIPFGAYVQIRGMEPDDAPEPDPSAFREKPLRSRMLVVAGGPIANYIAAIVMSIGVFAMVGMPVTEAIEIANVEPESPAAVAGLSPGDRLVAIGDVTIDPSLDGRDVSPTTARLRGQSVDVVVQRGGELVTVRAELRTDPDKGALGIESRLVSKFQPVPFGVAATAGFEAPFLLSAQQLEGLGLLVTGKASVAGPVKMVEQMAKEAEFGVVPFILQAAFISALLGLFNLLPLPALDGGRLAFLAYEGIARRRAAARIEEAVHGYGMLALLLLIAVVTVGDVRGILSR
jgi:regulator of sigma E protease